MFSVPEAYRPDTPSPTGVNILSSYYNEFAFALSVGVYDISVSFGCSTWSDLLDEENCHSVYDPLPNLPDFGTKVFRDCCPKCAEKLWPVGFLQSWFKLLYTVVKAHKGYANKVSINVVHVLVVPCLMQRWEMPDNSQLRKRWRTGAV